MKHTPSHLIAICALATVVTLIGTAGSAGCYADYKAKQDNPLKLHYGVIQLAGECSEISAKKEIYTRLRSNDWTLLNILSIFQDAGLDKRKDSAGKFFLRF